MEPDISLARHIDEQQIVALLGHLADRALTTGAHQICRCSYCAGGVRRRSYRMSSMCPDARTALRLSTPWGSPQDTRRSAPQPPPSAIQKPTSSLPVPLPAHRAGPRKAGRGGRLLRQQRGLCQAAQYRGAQSRQRARRPGQQVERGRDLTIAGEVVPVTNVLWKPVPRPRCCIRWTHNPSCCRLRAAAAPPH